jgi:phospholipid N-methyltransferase
MVTGIGIESATYVVELGSGTGVITLKILDSVNQQTNFIAIELDEHMYKAFKKHWPFVKIYNDSAENLSTILKKERVSYVDAIVSGLPWAAFPYALQVLILSEIVKNLSPGGYFTTFAYVQGLLLPSARRFKKMLKHHFSHVETSAVIWNNIPPALVYRCKK